MKIINLCNHQIQILSTDKQLITIPPSGEHARVVYDRKIVNQANVSLFKIPIKTVRPEKVIGIPLVAKRGHIYIVSQYCAFAIKLLRIKGHYYYPMDHKDQDPKNPFYSLGRV